MYVLLVPRYPSYWSLDCWFPFGEPYQATGIVSPRMGFLGERVDGWLQYRSEEAWEGRKERKKDEMKNGNVRFNG